ncbi:MAG TPA: M1 family metallopeptidase, partial [Gemmatimonadota bacterium]|nr:M1 family metallopeptidase [Gemmatimonadota bacterium]
NSRSPTSGWITTPTDEGSLRTTKRCASLLVLGSLLATPVVLAQTPPDGGVPSMPADRYERQAALDVLHYEIAIDIPAEGASVAGRTAVLYRAGIGGLNAVRLDLGAAMIVDSVSVDGASAPFERAGDRLVISAPAAADERREAVIWYHGDPADGLIIGVSRHGRRAIFADNWADRAHHWFPSIDHPSDKASVEFEVVAPAALEVVANGAFAGRIDLPGGRARTRWVESSEIPVYGMVIGVTDFAVERAGVVDGIEVSHWTFSEDSAAGAVAFARSSEILAFYDSLFGPYPYEKLVHVQSATKFGGMENPGAIFYDQEQIGTALAEDEAGREDLASLVAHETVHQWFGDAVTEADWNHLWLSEGFAEYFDAVFFEFHGGMQGRGPAELARQMRNRAANVLELDPAGRRAIYSPGAGPGEYETLLSAENYEKGAWVLHMLRRLIGDAAFFDGVRDYYATLRDDTAWTADFERVMEEASGRSLDWYFAQWIARPGVPALRAAVVDDGGSRRLRIEQVQSGEPYRLAFEVELRAEGAVERRSVEMEGRSTEISLELEGPVEVVIDPDAWLLFRDDS